MTDKKTAMQFAVWTFCMAYFTAGVVIVLGRHGFSVQSTVPDTFRSFRNFLPNLPFAIYILSPAIASYLVLKRNNKITGCREWLKTVFYVRNTVGCYGFVVAGLALYFFIHLAVSGRMGMELPLYLFFLNLPGNLVIGGMEEAGWSYLLQPALAKRYGYTISSLSFGVLWLLWHIPLFFIPGTAHYSGNIHFGMFAVQIIAFRFFYGAICEIAGKGGVFLCVLFHTMFNAASHAFGVPPATWAGTVAANTAIVLVSLLAVSRHNKKNRLAG